MKSHRKKEVTASRNDILIQERTHILESESPEFKS